MTTGSLLDARPRRSDRAHGSGPSGRGLDERRDLDAAGRADQDLDPLLRAREQLLAAPRELHAFLVDHERLLQRQLAGLQPDHDLAQPREDLIEPERSGVGGSGAGPGRAAGDTAGGGRVRHLRGTIANASPKVTRLTSRLTLDDPCHTPVTNQILASARAGEQVLDDLRASREAGAMSERSEFR